MSSYFVVKGIHPVVPAPPRWRHRSTISGMVQLSGVRDCEPIEHVQRTVYGAVPPECEAPVALKRMAAEVFEHRFDEISEDISHPFQDAQRDG
jgi:hypothetical protein